MPTGGKGNALSRKSNDTTHAGPSDIVSQKGFQALPDLSLRYSKSANRGGLRLDPPESVPWVMVPSGRYGTGADSTGKLATPAATARSCSTPNRQRAATDSLLWIHHLPIQAKSKNYDKTEKFAGYLASIKIGEW